MQDLDNYREVIISVECLHSAEGIEWRQHTTRTPEEMLSYALTVAGTVCEDKSLAHRAGHVATVIDADEHGQVGTHA